MIPRPPLASVSSLGAQPSDADLSAVAALVTTAYGRALLTLADQAALVALLPSYQAADADLTVLAAAPIVVPVLTAAAKVGSAVAVTVNLVDAAGNAISRAQRCKASVYSVAMLLATALTFTMAETGAGSEVSTTAKPTLLFDSDASGDAVITITDVSGVFTGTLYLEVVPVSTGSGGLGVPCIIAVSFA